MSPQAKGIKDLDGLPAGEIKLLISESECRTKDVIETRLTAQDERLDSMQNDLTSLVGTARITGLVQNVKSSIDGLVDKSNEWHEDDLTYRAEVKARMSNIETEQTRITVQVQKIRAFVVTSDIVGCSFRFCIEMLTNEAFWKVTGIVLTIVLTLWFPHLWHLLEAHLPLH